MQFNTLSFRLILFQEQVFEFCILLIYIIIIQFIYILYLTKLFALMLISNVEPIFRARIRNDSSIF